MKRGSLDACRRHLVQVQEKVLGNMQVYFFGDFVNGHEMKVAFRIISLPSSAVQSKTPKFMVFLLKRS